MSEYSVPDGWDAEKTRRIHQRMKDLPDDDKLRFAINWRMPHTLSNIASKMFRDENLDGVCWWTIYKSRDLGTWSHDGSVVVQAFR